MKRIVIIACGLAALVGSGIGAFVLAVPASATSAVTSAGVAGARAGHAPDAGPISSGAKYTYYAEDGGPSVAQCEVLTFGTKTFAGDKGDQGKYKSTSSTATVTFQNGAHFYAGVFTGTYESADAKDLGTTQYAGSFKLGKGTSDPGGSYGPTALVKGTDPWGVGGC